MPDFELTAHEVRNPARLRTLSLVGNLQQLFDILDALIDEIGKLVHFFLGKSVLFKVEGGAVSVDADTSIRTEVLHDFTIVHPGILAKQRYTDYRACKHS